MLFKMVDCHKNSTLVKFVVGDKDIIGRIKCGLFKLINGHLYFTNKVLKIRYDLLIGDSTHLNEYHIFDMYEDLLDLQYKEQI